MPGGTSKVTEKGQVTIPRDIRRRHKMEPGTTVVFADIDGVVTLRTFDEIEELFRQAHREAKKAGITRADVDKAVKAARKRSSVEFREKYGPRRS